MEKLVYDIIPRNQRSNPKGFRLLVKLKFNNAPSYLHSDHRTCLPHIDTCKHPRFALDNMFSFSSFRLFPSWVFSPPSNHPDPVMDEHTPRDAMEVEDIGAKRYAETASK